MSGRSAVAVFRAGYSSLPKLERFVDGFSVAGERELMRAKIVASELFDNLVAHGRGIRPSLVVVGLRAGPPFTLTLHYRSSNIDDFAGALEEIRPGTGRKVSPRYDESAGLYRGFGLAMCSRVSSSIRLRRGLLWHRVSVVF